MPFMVIYRTSDGSSRFEQADAIDQAALFVERLRNQESIDQIRIYRMEEIGFAFRPYYKVELGLSERQATPPPPTASTADPVEVAVEVPVDEVPVADVEEPRVSAVAEVLAEADLPLPPPPGDDGETAGANGRRGLFGR